MIDLRTAARLLNGDLSGRNIRCPGPGHGPKDRSLHVTFEAHSPAGFIVYSHAGDDPLGCKDFVRTKLGLPAFKAGNRRHIVRPAPAFAASNDDRERTERALSIWRETVEPTTLVETYLAHRGVLEAARPAFSRTIRFHGNCPFGPGTRVPCLVALVRNIRSDEPVAIHRTAIGPDGRSVEVGGRKRMALGPVAGGAVKLTPHKDVTRTLGIAEGLETTLSIPIHVPDFEATPLWALISAGGVAALPVLGDVETLVFGVDHDSSGVGLKAAKACSRRWTAAGREVLRVIPERTGADLNDLIRKA